MDGERAILFFRRIQRIRLAANLESRLPVHGGFLHFTEHIGKHGLPGGLEAGVARDEPQRLIDWKPFARWEELALSAPVIPQADSGTAGALDQHHADIIHGDEAGILLDVTPEGK